MKTKTLIASMSAITVLAVAASSVALQNQNAALPQAAPQEQPQGGPGGMPDLVGGLRATPGVLGVDAGRMQSGKQSIFAWFEDKQAVNRWYYSDMHAGVMKLANGIEGAGRPLEHVEDNSGPIMVIATITMARDQAPLEEVALPVSQISIELYKPLPGGAFVGSRLAPDSFKVPHMQDYTNESN